jgi:hypothetical protein
MGFVAAGYLDASFHGAAERLWNQAGFSLKRPLFRKHFEGRDGSFAVLFGAVERVWGKADEVRWTVVRDDLVRS